MSRTDDGTGVRERRLADATVEITLGQQLRQIRNANRTLEPGWAATVGSQLHAATHGALGVGAVSAPTVARGIEVMTRFSAVRAPHFRLDACAGPREVRLVPEDRVELDDDERTALLDIVMLSTQALVEAVLGRPMREGRFELSYAAPAHARRYREWFHGPVSFGHREAAVVIPAEWLRLESPLADPLLFDAAWRALSAGERRLEGDATVAARVEQLVERGGRLGSAAVARLLHVSRRTLGRRLRERGTTFRGLADASRRHRAESLLREPHLDVAEVAYAVGYEDAANFGRACRRWFGMSAGAYRRRLLERR